MNEAKPKRRWFQFSIRELLLITVVVALAVGWWLNRAENQQLRNNYAQLKSASDATIKFNIEAMDQYKAALSASEYRVNELRSHIERERMLEAVDDRKKIRVDNMPILAPPTMTHAPSR